MRLHIHRTARDDHNVYGAMSQFLTPAALVVCDRATAIPDRAEVTAPSLKRRQGAASVEALRS